MIKGRAAWGGGVERDFEEGWRLVVKGEGLGAEEVGDVTERPLFYFFFSLFL